MQLRYIHKSLLIVLSFLLSCQTNKDKSLKSEWISTNREHWSNPGIFLDLTDNDTLYITQDFDFDNLSAHKYQIDSVNNLILDDTLFYGEIIKHTDYILLIKDSFRIKSFIPIRDYGVKTDTNELKDFLISNDWEIDEGLVSMRIEFKNEPWFFNPSRLKKYYRINESKGWESFDCEWWTFEEYRNSLFIILSHWQAEYQVYQIKSISDSEILTETCWTDSLEEVKFSVQKKLPNDNYKNLINTLIGTWQLIDYEEPIDSLRLLKHEEEIIPIKSNGRYRPYLDEDSIPMILDTYFNDKTISYTFSKNGECSMDMDSYNLRKANWELSGDGKYIHTEKGLMRSMRIISITDSILITEKHEIIEYHNKNIWSDKYIREKLRKITVPNTQ